MKKIMEILLSIIVIISGIIPAFAINVHVNNQVINMDVAPVIVEGRTLVPVAAISQALNGEVKWDGTTKTVTITRNNQVITLQLENKIATINNQNITLDVPAQAIDGRTMVPVGFIAQAFGEKVEWHKATQTVLINSNAPVSQNVPATQVTQVTPAHATYKIVRIVDGDTLVINYNGVDEKVRLIGVDTPESVHPDATKNNEFGKIASEFSKNYLDGKEVTLEIDVQERDQYGRILAYVYVSGQMYNKTLLQEGMAKVATYPPNVKYVDDFKALEKTARENNNGLWAYNATPAEVITPVVSITPNVPSQPTADNTKQYVDENGNGLIKGNISSSDEKIYHVPGMRDYNKTKIDTSMGEMWFKTEQEAKDAGFRRAMQ